MPFKNQTTHLPESLSEANLSAQFAQSTSPTVEAKQLDLLGKEEEEELPFVQVTSKRGRRNTADCKTSAAPANSRNPRSNLWINREVEDIDEASVKRKIATAREQIRSSSFYASANSLLSRQLPSHPTAIICFGIGRFADCHIACNQLAFILELRQAFHVPRILFHEPALCAAEVRILRDLNCNLHPKNVEGKHRLLSDESGTAHTLIFLPHCPKQLTNNLLWANWTPTALNSCSLLCNSFGTLHDSTPHRFLSVDAGYILRILPYTTEVKLPNGFQHTDVFNDTSLHHFRVPASGFCEPDPSEPSYSSHGNELITSTESR